MKGVHDDRTNMPLRPCKKSASVPKDNTLGDEADFLLECDGTSVRSSCAFFMVCGSV